MHYIHYVHYTYTRQGQTVQGQTDQEAEYVSGRMTMRKGNKAETDAAAPRFKPGLHFQMSEVTCKPHEQSCYISTPIKVVSNLRHTEFSACAAKRTHPTLAGGPPTSAEHREVTTK